MVFWYFTYFRKTLIDQSLWIFSRMSWWCHPLTIFIHRNDKKSHFSYKTVNLTFCPPKKNNKNGYSDILYKECQSCICQKKNWKCSQFHYNSYNWEGLTSHAHPIEYLWGLVKQCFQKKRCDISKCHSFDPYFSAWFSSFLHHFHSCQPSKTIILLLVKC